MNNYSGNSANEFLYSLPDNTAEMTQSDAGELVKLISTYPQSSILRLLLAAKGEQNNIEQAAAYVKPTLLFKIAKGSNKLPFVSPGQVVLSKTSLNQSTADLETQEDVITEANYFHITTDPLAEDLGIETSGKAQGIDTASAEAETDGSNMNTPSFSADNVSETAEADLKETANPVIEEAPANSGTGYFHQEIDDEVFEEIVGIEDIDLQQLQIADKVIHKDVDSPTITPAVNAVVEDKYFVFKPSLANNDESSENNNDLASQAAPTVAEAQPVAKYHDEKMPYSFMWWLDKTRREHASSNQPYAPQRQDLVAKDATKEEVPQLADHLQQQYYENIFAVSAVVGELSLTPVKVAALPVETKEDKIIERFIQEEPQIKHPNDAKLNNENKAKKSSEDKDELVTETLAKIYSDQMLYHKAILTYKKLMLKFPEKSTYFAGQIEQLENKIN